MGNVAAIRFLWGTISTVGLALSVLCVMVALRSRTFIAFLLSLLARDSIMCPFALASPAPFLRRKRPNNQLQPRLTSVEARPGA